MKGIQDYIAVEIAAEERELSLESSAGKYHHRNVLAVENSPLPSQNLSRETTKICYEKIGVEIKSYFNASPTLLLGQDN